VYCPLNKKLLAGVMDHGGESWSAVINLNNEWVQVGNEIECELYTEKYGKEPEWGLDGRNNEMITRHIMCCRSHPYEEGSVWNVPNQPGSPGNEYVHKPIVPLSTESSEESDNAGTDIAAVGGSDGGAETDIGTNTEDTTVSENNEATASDEITSDTASSTTSSPTKHHDIAAAEGLSSMTEWELQVQIAHHPAWFSNEFGWEGTTYSDAEAFCNGIPHGKSTLELCPLQVSITYQRLISLELFASY
jgi:hypothetical protein